MLQVLRQHRSHIIDQPIGLSRIPEKIPHEPMMFSQPMAMDRHDRTKPPCALTDLAKLVGAEDIFVIAHPLELSDWTIVYAGPQCVQAGIDMAGLAMLRVGSGRDLCWVQLLGSTDGSIVLVSSLRGSGGTHYIVGLLFDALTVTDHAAAETAFDDASALLCSVIELYYEAALNHNKMQGAHYALDCADAGVVLLNAAGRVMHENGIAKLLLDCGAGLRRCGPSVASTDVSDAVRFRMGIEQALATGIQTEKITAPLLALKRGKHQRPLLVCIIPTRSPAYTVDAVSLIIFLYDPDRKILHLLRSACQLYELSPVETELACRLACGESLADAAAALRIKELTARGYLKQIFIKTGVNRQAALVQLLLSSTVHLADDLELLVI